MDFILGSLMMWTFGAVFSLPWVLIKLGIYKRWYMAPTMLPVSWKGGLIAMFPASAFFWFAPLLILVPPGIDPLAVWGIIGFGGLIVGLIIAIWTPRWAKPRWQQYLEDTYPKTEIRRYVLVWKKIPPRQWSELLDSEEGIDELVAIARAELGE